MANINTIRLTNTAGTAITSLNLTNGTAVYSNAIDLSRCGGNAALLVTENKSGGTGDVDISMQYSADGTNWYTAYTTNLAGVLAAEGNLVTTLQNATRYIVFTARVAKYARVMFDPDADSTVTADFIFEEGT